MEQAQSDPQVLQALARAQIYPHPVDSIEHIQTHISHIFLTGHMAYKLKKPVDLGFLDFRGLAERKQACLEELRLNRRLAPEIYRQVVAVVRTRDGLALIPWDKTEGEVLDYAVQMVQMDQERMMDRLLDQGEVTAEKIAELARLLARFYASEPGGPQVSFAGRPSQVRLNVEENFRQTQDYQGICVSPQRWRAVRDYSLDFLREHRELFKQRVAQGRVVDGHGDLHSGNINLPKDGPPIVFDCIEFNQRFRWQDAACDLAFLAMDLDHHGRRDLREVLVAEYITAGGDRDLLRVLNFYMCYRAVVRAKVYGFMHEDPGLEFGERFRDMEKARAYFRQAADYAGGEPPFFLVCFMGMMGTGKSYLAKLLAQATGWPRLSSDVVRKQRAGMPPDQASRDAWGQGLYGPTATVDTYEALIRRAGSRLEMGDSVIVDASFREQAWRERFIELAAREGATPLVVEVYASSQVVHQRLAKREAKGGSASDGRRELMAAQAAGWEAVASPAAEHLLRVDGGEEAEVKMTLIIARLEELGYIPNKDLEG